MCVCVCVRARARARFMVQSTYLDPKHCNLISVPVRPPDVCHPVLNSPFKALRFCLQNAFYEMFHSPPVTHEHVFTLR